MAEAHEDGTSDRHLVAPFVHIAAAYGRDDEAALDLNFRELRSQI